MRFHWFDLLIRVCCLIAALTFVFRYSRYHWERSEEGRHLMTMTATIAGFLGLVVSFAFFGPGIWYVWVTRFFFVCLFFLLVQRNRLLSKAQKHRKDNPEMKTTSPEGATKREEEPTKNE